MAEAPKRKALLDVTQVYRVRDELTGGKYLTCSGCGKGAYLLVAPNKASFIPITHDSDCTFIEMILDG